MELLDRYLQAVREYMIRSHRDDFVKELGGNILSQMEDRAAELGRPLNESEQAEILKQFGHPLVVAAPYRKLPMQQLVGPKLFPLYWFVLQAMLFFIFAFHLVLAVVLGLSHHSVVDGIAGAWGSFWLWIFAGTGGLTICFGLMEYFGGGKIPFTNTFDPFQLPELKATARRDKAQVELIMGILFLIGWPLFLNLPWHALTAAIPVRMAPAWKEFEIPMLLAVALGVASAFIALFRSHHPRLRAMLRLASDIVGIATLSFFLLAGEFIIASADAAARLNSSVAFGSHTFTVLQITNYAAALGPLIALIVFFFDGLTEIVRLLRTLKQPGIVTQQSAGIF